ncbi:hypothetical protein [Aquitalea aquatica]|uniref:Receptor-recognising protein Gp38 domain-containing protein n=1 Tax=Aquitalea aquatica TaxID=3044273 RepID=A0A838Y4F8_9NEIS|nr:hypothetical protein [Aquitalea magnusonii]MBA4709586.1 hypothetical protein [Aquitalea magnusonii]
MPKTFIDGREVKRWWLDGREVSRAYLDGRLVFQKETIIRISAHDHGITGQWVIDRIQTAFAGAPPAGASIRFVIESGIQLVSANAGEGFRLDGSWWNGTLASCQIIIENYGYLLGRGGKGGTGSDRQAAQPGSAGGDALVLNNMNVRIDNRGIIAGGGGGGAACGNGGLNACGGGGAPFGPDGDRLGNAPNGVAGTFDQPGRGGIINGVVRGGYGGAWGERGGGSTNYPDWHANAGHAIRSNGAAVTWINRGDIRGNAP